MGLEITITYKNSSQDIIRVDNIYMTATSNSIATGIRRKTYYRQLETTLLYGPASRVVDSMDLITNADIIDGSAYSFVTWSAHDVTCNLSDLPSVGDTI